jgi:hypothetical protein
MRWTLGLSPWRDCHDRELITVAQSCRTLKLYTVISSLDSPTIALPYSPTIVLPISPRLIDGWQYVTYSTPVGIFSHKLILKKKKKKKKKKLYIRGMG